MEDRKSDSVKHNKLNDEVLDSSEKIADPKSMMAATHDTDEAKATAPPKVQKTREEIGVRK